MKTLKEWLLFIAFIYIGLYYVVGHEIAMNTATIVSFFMMSFGFAYIIGLIYEFCLSILLLTFKDFSSTDAKQRKIDTAPTIIDEMLLLTKYPLIAFVFYTFYSFSGMFVNLTI